MSTSRSGHVATLLGNGKVFVTGASATPPISTSTELYDPAANVWTMASSMSTPRTAHTATLLTNGKVLVAGGTIMIGAGDAYATAELYDPTTNTWMTASSMGVPRLSHTATLLATGNVLVTGGMSSLAATGSFAIATAELYNPVTDVWTAVPSMSNARRGHTATLLTNGKVLVAGGMDASNSAGSATADLYDPVTNSWTAGASMNSGTAGHAATLLANGKVLVSGGSRGNLYASAAAELYDPVANTWTTVSSMGRSRSGHTATRLADGQILVAGGYGGSGNSANSELYDPVANAWSPVLSMVSARSGHTATLLANGEVLVTGGYGTSSSPYTAELYLSDEAPPTTTDDVSAVLRGPGVGVTLVASDNGRAGVKRVGGLDAIYYTIGSSPPQPTTSSAQFDPFHKPTLSHGQRIRYFAVDAFDNAETAHSSGAANVDEEGPTTTDDVPAAFQRAGVTVTLDASDQGGGADRTYYTVGSSPAQPTRASAVYDTTRKPILGNGQMIRYFSVDIYGNAETPHSSPRAHVDTRAPATTDDVLSGGSSTRLTVTLSPDDAGGSGIDQTYYTIGSSPAQPTSASAVYDAAHKPTLGDGQRIRYFSTDRVGHAETAHSSLAAHVAAPPKPGVRCPRGTSASVRCEHDGRGRLVMIGTGAGETFVGTGADDFISALGGDDVISAGAGNDRIASGSGSDRVKAGVGNDRINGDSGDDLLSGGAGNDVISGAAGSDRINGGAGEDRLNGNGGGDRLFGDAGKDVLSGGTGNDRLSGGSGVDRLTGGAGDDHLRGNQGRDHLTCGAGRDDAGKRANRRRDSIDRDCER